MLSICVGPNGSGKSLWAVHQIIKFLMDDERLIVTSVALNLPRLNEYLQERHGQGAPDVMRRILLIDGEQMQKFWRFRGLRVAWTDGQEDSFAGVEPIEYGPFIDLQDKGTVVEERDPRWARVDKGVIYVLDEIQTKFGARDWQKTGPEFMAYQSQHRKYDDDVIAIAPASSLIDKQFRILSGECITLSNWYKLKVGLIKAPRKIHYSIYQNCPPQPSEPALSSGSFRIDGEGLASCYNTAAGLGIVGKDADKGKEAKGLPFYSLFGILILAGVIVWFLMSRLVGYAANYGVRKAQVAKPVQSTNLPPEVGAAGVGQQVGTLPAPAVTPLIPQVPTNKVVAVFYSGRNSGGPKVVLSDGRTYGSPEVDWIQQDKVSIGGKVYPR